MACSNSQQLIHPQNSSTPRPVSLDNRHCSANFSLLQIHHGQAKDCTYHARDGREEEARCWWRHAWHAFNCPCAQASVVGQEFLDCQQEQENSCFFISCPQSHTQGRVRPAQDTENPEQAACVAQKSRSRQDERA